MSKSDVVRKMNIVTSISHRHRVVHLNRSNPFSHCVASSA
jgi:hypothetical protein